MRIVIVDGHPTMRLGLRTLLCSAGLRVVGESGNGEEALRLVAKLKPDLVILGLNLVDEMDGVETCWSLKGLARSPRVVVHTIFNLTYDVSAKMPKRASTVTTILRERAARTYWSASAVKTCSKAEKKMPTLTP